MEKITGLAQSLGLTPDVVKAKLAEIVRQVDRQAHTRRGHPQEVGRTAPLGAESGLREPLEVQVLCSHEPLEGAEEECRLLEVGDHRAALGIVSQRELGKTSSIFFWAHREMARSCSPGMTSVGVVGNAGRPLSSSSKYSSCASVRRIRQWMLFCVAVLEYAASSAPVRHGRILRTNGSPKIFSYR